MARTKHDWDDAPCGLTSAISLGEYLGPGAGVSRQCSAVCTAVRSKPPPFGRTLNIARGCLPRQTDSTTDSGPAGARFPLRCCCDLSEGHLLNCSPTCDLGASMGSCVFCLLSINLRLSFFNMRLFKIGHGSLRSFASAFPLPPFG